jgi:hypothetical protein
VFGGEIILKKEDDMLRGSVVAVILVSLVVPMNQLLGQGRDVKVMLRNGGMIEGELLCVQDSSLLVGAAIELARENPSDPTAGVKRIPTSKVAVVTMEGSSYVLLGVGLGLVVGALAGGAIAASQIEEPRNLGEAVVMPLGNAMGIGAGALIGGLGGMLLGGIIGGAASQSERNITQNSPGGMALLSQFAKYPDGEPEFLKAVP